MFRYARLRFLHPKNIMSHLILFVSLHSIKIFMSIEYYVSLNFIVSLNLLRVSRCSVLSSMLKECSELICIFTGVLRSEQYAQSMLKFFFKSMLGFEHICSHLSTILNMYSELSIMLNVCSKYLRFSRICSNLSIYA